MSFTCEEVWGYLPEVGERSVSVHTAAFPSSRDLVGVLSKPVDLSQQNDWGDLRAIRDEVLKKLEEKRNEKLIGTGLEAQVTITAADPEYAVLTRYVDQLRYLFIVSAVRLEKAASGNGTGGVAVQVEKAAGRSASAVGTTRRASGRIRHIPWCVSVAARC